MTSRRATAMLDDKDAALLTQTLALAEKDIYTTAPNPRVGCLIRRGEQTLATGRHERAGGAHAEINALDNLAASGGDAVGADIYISLEPCVHHGKTPPCVDALIAARPARVIIALLDANPQVAGNGVQQLRAAGISVVVAPAESAVADNAREMNIGFIARMTRDRPWLRLKIAATMDGKTALNSGLSRWISGAAARRDAHALRARSCAVLTGVGTALEDNPQLNVRDIATTRQPLRLLVDSQLKTPPTAALFADDNILVAAAKTPPRDYPADVWVLPNEQGKVDLAQLLERLAQRQINEITVEAGRKLAGALLDGGHVDELVLYMAPRLFGDSGKDMLALPPPATPAQALRWRRLSVDALPEDDLKIVYRPHAVPAQEN